MKRVICKSGLKGWQSRLQRVYKNYEEFCNYNSIYNIAARLGYRSTRIVWKKNPIIQCSINPSDLSIVSS